MIDRYLTGLALAVSAAILLYLGEDVWSLLPAIAGVYILGSTLWDTMKN